MVKIVFMYSRRAIIYNKSYDESIASDKHNFGDYYIIPVDARLDGIEDKDYIDHSTSSLVVK